MPPHPSPPAPDAAAEAEAKWLTEALLDRPDCENFRRLYELRRHIAAMGIAPRFRSPPPADVDLTAQRADLMYQALRWMDEESNWPGFARDVAWFLDIGSNPGGFARYILENPRARGVGVSLPVDEGGLGRADPPNDRFEPHELNLLDLVSRYLHSDPASRSLPFTRDVFDFIILDADPSSPRLLLAQLLLALSTVYDGGHVLLTLSYTEWLIATRILIAFSRIADYIDVCVPPQTTRGGVFFVHAQTIRVNTPAYRKFKDNLERLWNLLHTDGARDPTWHEEDLITPWEEVMKKSSMDLIVKLGNPIWGTQLTALYRALGIRFDTAD